MMIETVSINKFVRRQVKGSGKTYADSLTFEEIAFHGEKQLKKGHYTEGYRDGVILVQVDKKLISHFFCPFVKIDETTALKAEIVRRRPEEDRVERARVSQGPRSSGSRLVPGAPPDKAGDYR